MSIPALSIIGDALAPYALITTAQRYIGTIIPDVVVEEIHHDTMMITQHPVETGATISDHAFKMPVTVEVRGGFSDSTAQASGYVQFAYEQFLALQASRVPFNVSTGKRQYANMLVYDLAITTDVNSEFALNFVAILQEVIITSTTANAGASASTQAMPQQSAGSVNTGAASTAVAGSQPTFATVNPALNDAGIGHA